MSVIGIGTEIVECLRIAQMIERHDESFLRRVYTQKEIEFCSARGHASQHYAARWAGKLAVLKALGSSLGGFNDWRDVELRPLQGNRVSVALAGDPKETCVNRQIAKVMVDLSFCRTHASAFAIASASDGLESLDLEDL